jgi:hypothetical protein
MFAEKIMKRFIAIAIAAVSMAACEKSAQREFGWLVGTWKLKDKNVYEAWKDNGDGSLSGLSFIVSGADTTVQEKITLLHKDGSYHYIPDVPQNASPVDFTVTEFSNSHFVAENPAHDFPKVIRYTIVRKPEGEIIEASIEGNGQVIPYAFQKVR